MACVACPPGMPGFVMMLSQGSSLVPPTHRAPGRAGQGKIRIHITDDDSEGQRFSVEQGDTALGTAAMNPALVTWPSVSEETSPEQPDCGT